VKKKDYTAIIIVVLVICAIIAYTIYFSGRNQKGRYIWAKTYEDGLQQPYDFGLFKALLKNRSGHDFEVIEGKLKDRLEQQTGADSSAYVFIGRYCYLNKGEIDAMMNFAGSGHSVVLIAEGMPDTLLKSLSYFARPISIKRFDEFAVHARTYRYQSPEYHFKFRGFDHDSTENTDWYFLDEKEPPFYFYGESGNRYISQGKINGKLNYAKFKVGNGLVYIHTSPLLFTNYALRDENGFNYADEVFSGIDTRQVLYDVYSREYKEDSEEIHKQSDSALSYILKQPALRWAWYLFLAAVVLFFVFKAKRRQRIIPVLEQKRNTSIRFIDTLSGLFYKDATHRDMAETRMNLFLFFLRSKLRMSTHDINPQLLKQISVRSKVGEADIKAIFDYHANIIQNGRRAFSGEDLIEFYNLTDTFYQSYNSKK
jgi:hypothetical protein